MSEKKDTKQNEKVIDDGRTIADMNVKGFRWYSSEKNKRRRKEFADLKITKAERRAMIKGALQVILPIALTFLGIFLAIFLIIYFWLS